MGSVISDNNKRLIKLSVIRLSGGYYCAIFLSQGTDLLSMLNTGKNSPSAPPTSKSAGPKSDDILIKVSISPTFYEQLFCRKVFCAAFMCLQFIGVNFTNIYKQLLRVQILKAQKDCQVKQLYCALRICTRKNCS